MVVVVLAPVLIVNPSACVWLLNMPAFERTPNRIQPCTTTTTAPSPWFCCRRSRRRRRFRAPRDPLLPPEDADDLQEQAGALCFPSRGRIRIPVQRRRDSSRRRLAAGELARPPLLITRLMTPGSLTSGPSGLIKPLD